MTALVPINAPQRRSISIGDFETLIERGSFADVARAELIAGEIFVVKALYRPHAVAQTRMTSRINIALEALHSALEAINAPSVRCDDRFAPEPDIVVTSEPVGEKMVPLNTVQLVVEVSHSTLDNDLSVKSALYARFCIPEYWVLDIDGHRLHQFATPVGTDYTVSQCMNLGHAASSLTIAGLTIATDNLF